MDQYDDDVNVMYSKHAGKTAILLWAYSCVLTSSLGPPKKLLVISQNTRLSSLKSMKNMMSYGRSMAINIHLSNCICGLR